MESSNTNQSHWYQRKGLVFLLCFLFFPLGIYGLWKNDKINKTIKIIITVFCSLLVIGVLTEEEKPSSEKEEVNTTEEVKKEEKIQSPKDELSNYLKSVSGDNINFDDYSDVASFSLFTDMYNEYSKIYEKYKNSSDKEVKSLCEEYKNRLIQSQVKNFPKARASYFKLLKNTMWENDIEVGISGKGNTMISLVGGYFAANRNIKSSQEALVDMLYGLRFKRTTYQWFEEQEDYTYYDIESSSDSEIVVE
jgi:hypothetical protein